MSLVYFDWLNGLIFAYRDVFGKRSLILLWDEMNQILGFSSTMLGFNMNSAFELPSDSLTVLRTDENLNV